MPFKKLISGNLDFIFIVFVLFTLLLLFTPVSPHQLDFLLLVNFSISLTLLLLTLYVDKPVAFSTFPALLLIATLFRLALNVASTRLILTDADAGDIITAVGNFAVQGSFVVGLVVFFILVVVQYVVVTAGAQRVSEVAARFVLDSVPGQQMSIDADLNMGLIDQNEAKRRRKNIEKEASFYGSMDGASKFVKGDAIAGVIILLINIIAGWIIGVAQMGMDWLTALQTFSLLTIGDGIVTQIPALIVSTATGLIVTRSSSDRNLGREVVAQLTSIPKIALLVTGVLIVLMLAPGMPKWPIAILAAVGLSAWYFSRKQVSSGLTDAAATEEGDGPDASKPIPVIEVRLGSHLSSAWKGMNPVLSERISALRQQEEAALGFKLPAVTFVDGAGLGSTEYEIVIHGARHGKGSIIPDRTLALGTGASGKIHGVEAIDPAFGLPGVWIGEDQRDAASDAGFTLVDPITILMTHLAEVLRSAIPQLLTRNDVIALLEGVRERQPGMIEDLIPGVLAVSDIQRVLQSLLAESVSIRQIDLIIDALVDIGRHTKDHVELTERVRQKLGFSIFSALRGSQDSLSVLSLGPKLETQLLEAVRRQDKDDNLIIDPKLAEAFLRKLIPLVDNMIGQKLTPVLLCGAELRRPLKAFTRRSAPRLAVVSVSEVPTLIDLRSFGVVVTD